MKILPTDFEGQSIRRVFDEDLDVWWFSVIDVVQVLTESKAPSANGQTSNASSR
jgi:DNA-damage-inducible protein D